MLCSYFFIMNVPSSWWHLFFPVVIFLKWNHVKRKGKKSFTKFSLHHTVTLQKKELIFSTVKCKLVSLLSNPLILHFHVSSDDKIRSESNPLYVTSLGFVILLRGINPWKKALLGTKPEYEISWVDTSSFFRKSRILRKVYLSLSFETEAV